MYQIVRLQEGDYYKGYLELLRQLTVVEDVSYDDFCKQFSQINSNVFVVKQNEIVIGTASIIIERKFIRGMKSVGHIEDVVVDFKHRGCGIGKQLLDFLVDYAKNNNCYKVILNCSDDNVGFYQKVGFNKKEVEMCLYF